MLPDQKRSVEVPMGSHTVRVPEGGLYQRYQMHTDLDEVSKDPRVPGVEFFRQLPKTTTVTAIGPSVTPNFYYSVSTARLLMLAPTSAIRQRLPRVLSPLQVAPGLGLVAVMFYRYDVCDIDFYNEVAIGIPVQPARHGPLGFIDLAASLKNDHQHAYVLSLPVNTEIANVRGREMYGLPKWVTDIDIQIDSQRSVAQIANDSGGIDLAFTAVTPPQSTFASTKRVGSTTGYSQINGEWYEFLNQTNILSAGRQVMPKNIHLHLGRGRLSDDLRSLKAGKILSLDVSTSSQIALHMPTPYSVPNR